MPVFSKPSLTGTKRLLGLVIKPRPSVRALRLRRSTRPTFKFYSPPDYIHSPRPTSCRPSALADAPFACDRGASLNTVDEERIGSESLDSSTESNADPNMTSEEAIKPYELRSYRHRKSKSINEAELELAKMKDDPKHVVANTWPRTQAKSIAWTLSTCSDSISYGSGTSSSVLFRHVDDTFPVVSPSLVQTPSVITGQNTSGYSEYVTAPSCLDDPTFYPPRTYTDEPHVLQAVDRGSGAVFERVCQGTLGEVDVQDAPNVISSNIDTNDVSYHVVPLLWLAATDSLRRKTRVPKVNAQAPSLILTVPTPAIPQSPVFVLQSPITVSKFFSATATPMLGPTSLDQYDSSPLPLSPQTLAPSLTSCGRCGLFEFDQGSQCRACDERWLACRVWYRANDGGHRRWLTEPFIRPGECNERNRAMMRGLGVADCFCDAGVDNKNALDRGLPSGRVKRVWHSVTCVLTEIKTQNGFKPNMVSRKLKVLKPLRALGRVRTSVSLRMPNILPRWAVRVLSRKNRAGDAPISH